MAVSLLKSKKVHIIGIEGAGTSAMARTLKLMGKEVSGSDEGDHFFYRALKNEEIKITHKFDEKNIPADADLIIYGSAFKPETNPELDKAFQLNLPLMTYAEALAQLFNQKYGIAICGTHGKTTTSAMLADVMKSVGVDPSAMVGSRVFNWGGGALVGKGDFFVIEADEFQNKLRLYEPKAVILTSADWDHPDCYPTFEEYKKAFSDFVGKIPKKGLLVVWGDSVATSEIACSAKCEIIKYGFQEDNDVVISNSKFLISNQTPNPKSQIPNKSQIFEINYSGKSLGEFQTKLVGNHNLLNCAAVIAVCHKLKIDMEKVRLAIREFKGTSRRFEYIGQRNGAILIDDYGHHPEEVRVTLKATRELYPDKNIIAVFHPHSYSRTEALLQEFGQSFDAANAVVVLDIYGSARENTGNVSSRDLVDLINKYDSGKAEYVPTINGAVEYLKNKIGSDDVVLCIGAGNVFEVAEKLKEKTS